MLHKHVFFNELEQAEKALQEGVEINKLDSFDGMRFNVPVTPLVLAVYRNHLEMVKLLLRYGADVNAAIEGGKTPIFHAQSKQVAEMLVHHGADIEIICRDDKYNPVMLMLWKERLEPAEYLLSLGTLPKHWSPFFEHDMIQQHKELIQKYQ